MTMMWFTSRRNVVPIILVSIFHSGSAIKPPASRARCQCQSSSSIGRSHRSIIDKYYDSYSSSSISNRSKLAFASPFARISPNLKSKRLLNTSCTLHPNKSIISPLHGHATTDNDRDNRKQINHYDLTILIPAYNERDRIGNTLSTYIDVLSRTPVYQGNGIGSTPSNCSKVITPGSVSIMVVDDGSTDGTADYIRGRSWRVGRDPTITMNENNVEEDCWKVDDNVMCISLPENAGKGAAIERGMAELPSFSPESNIEDKFPTAATRSIVLVADADGSGDISCIDNMLHSLEELTSTRAVAETMSTQPSLLDQQPQALVVGYRQYPESKGPLRALLSWGFRTCVSLIFLGRTLGVRDTQCGFKLMTTSTGKVLYDELNLRRWTHDVEVVYRANLLGVPVGECGVSWVDKEGSKLVTKASDAVLVSLIMLREIATMRIKYALGMWKVKIRNSDKSRDSH